MSDRNGLRDALADLIDEVQVEDHRYVICEHWPAEGGRSDWPALQRVLDAIEGQRPSLNEIGAIIADGYDTDYSTQEIAVAVFEYVTRGEPNRFLQEADDLHGEPAAPTPEASR